MKVLGLKVAVATAGVAVIAAGGALAAISFGGGSSPQPVQVIAPADATGSTTTLAVTTTVATVPATTTTLAPATTVPVATTVTTQPAVTTTAAPPTTAAGVCIIGVYSPTCMAADVPAGYQVILGTEIPAGWNNWGEWITFCDGVNVPPWTGPGIEPPCR